MRAFKWFAVVSATCALTACGGGGSGGGGNSPVVVQPLALAVTLSASSQSTTVAEGATATTVKFSATYSANRTFTTPVVADIAYDKTVYSSVTVAPGATANSFDVTATTLANLPGGAFASPITLRLCQEAACTNVYSGASTTFTHNLTVNLQEWSTFQRNASHNGFVHTNLDPSKFAYAWTWQAPGTGRMGAVVTGGGKVYATTSSYFGTGSVYAVNEKDGSVAWKSDFPNQHSIGSATYDGASLYIAMQDASENSGIVTLNSSDGKFVNKMTFYTQWAEFISPTVFGSNVYFGGEGSVYSFAPATASNVWSTNIPNFTQGKQTPAVDQNFVYFSTGASYGYSSRMEIFNRSDGSVYADIADPLGSWSGYIYYGAPMLGAANSLIAFTGEGSQNSNRLLARFDVTAKTLTWHTNSAYVTTPAYANGVIYAAQNAPMRLDAISETTGSVIWSWTPPVGDTSFYNNVIVTDNLVFVSTDQNVYAIDLNTHKTVWSYKAAGTISIGASFTLYIATGGAVSDNGLLAIKLR